MAWDWERIEREWLNGGRIAVPCDVATTAFDRVEAVLGSDWLMRRRGPGGTAYGSGPTLSVVNTGQLLAVLDGVAGADRLIERVRRDDGSAKAELVGLYLLRSGRPDALVELEPEVEVVGRRKKPDFRITAAGDATCVEVTQPDLSEEHTRAADIIERIAGMVHDIEGAFALEVFLRRMPTETELAGLMARVPDFCRWEGVHREELGDLGLLLLNLDEPSWVTLRDHDEEQRAPRISVLRVQHLPGVCRHICVRLAFADQRAQQFLESEARQLPKDGPGLIMVAMWNAAGGFGTWEPLLRRRLQPALHTRVSGVCLFTSGVCSTPDGEAWVPRTKLIVNPHARHPLPEWVHPQLARFASDIG